MTNIRRHFRPGQTYFLTHVTHQRAPILKDNETLFHNAFEKTGLNDSYSLRAWVILPDHAHMLIDPLDCDLSNLIRRIKLTFSASYRTLHRLKSGRLWQNRYWDHIIRDEEDMNKHIDYIHTTRSSTVLWLTHLHTSIHQFMITQSRAYTKGIGVAN